MNCQPDALSRCQINTLLEGTAQFRTPAGALVSRAVADHQCSSMASGHSGRKTAFCLALSVVLELVSCTELHNSPLAAHKQKLLAAAAGAPPAGADCFFSKDFPYKSGPLLELEASALLIN